MSRWLFSARVDLAVFLGSASASIVFLLIGARLGVLHADTPDWAWIPAVLLVDVAHVWATLFRTYLDGRELRRRPWLYALVPTVSFVAASVLWSFGAAVFWRVLAYVAIAHFVRQQWGWVALYRARAGERDRLGRIVDSTAVYAATLYPLLHWHTHLPRKFAWFVAGDVIALPAWLDAIGKPLWIAALLAWVVHSTWRWVAHRRGSIGKDVVIATTALCWWLGIVAFDSDYAFTVTNVFIHGIPYFALVFVFDRRERSRRTHVLSALAVFFGVVWLLAYGEELFWDRTLWQDRPWLFGAAWELGAWRAIVVPLLVVPQLSHYVLDGFIWKRRSNPRLDVVLDLAPAKIA